MDWPASMKLDQEILLNFGSSMQRLKIFPYFDIAHYILTISSLRDDLGPSYSLFSRRFPLNCWLWSMLACFAGSFLTNFLLGEPIIAVLKRPEDLLLASVTWYLVFYSPFDLFYMITHILPLKIPIAIMKECQRAYKINQGVSYALRLYPNAYLIHILVGTAKGAGTGIIRVFDDLVVGGVWTGARTEVARLSFTTKAVVICSVLLTLDKAGFIHYCPHEITYLGIVLFFVYFKLSAILLQVTDPLAPFENVFCAVFLGGIWDALARAIETSRERRSGEKNENPTGSGGVGQTVSPPEHKKAQ